MSIVIENSFCKTWMDARGITHIEYFNDTDIDLTKAKELIALFVPKKDSPKLYILKDLRKIRSVSTDAMEYLSSRAITRFILAEALIVNNLSSRLLANFFIKKYCSPEVDCEKFETEEEAINWIFSKKQQKQN